MHAIWKWCFRLAVGTGAFFVVVTILFVYGITRAHVTQSDGWQPINGTSAPQTLSQSLPASATKFCFARSSVGLGGRFMAYAVDGAPEDLDAFAEIEFAAHWDNPGYTIDLNAQSPFDSEYIGFLKQAYSVDLDWLSESSKATGSIYRDTKKQGSHMPTIFVDKANGVLYFVMTD